jgi:hypothetical protein
MFPFLDPLREFFGLEESLTATELLGLLLVISVCLFYGSGLIRRGAQAARRRVWGDDGSAGGAGSAGTTIRPEAQLALDLLLDGPGPWALDADGELRPQGNYDVRVKTERHGLFGRRRRAVLAFGHLTEYVALPLNAAESAALLAAYDEVSARLTRAKLAARLEAARRSFG